MTPRWWAAAVALAILAVVWTLANPNTMNWPFELPVWVRAILNGVVAVVWVWFVEGVVSFARRVMTRARA